MGAKVKKEDRLFSLILALISTREGLTKTEILRTVRGYSDLFTHDANPTLDKMFERDKEEIRSMGVVIDTYELPEEEGQTHNVRYSISHSQYDFPEDVSFSAEEMTLLNVAAQAWREASLSSDSRQALTKLRSLGIPAQEDLIGVAPCIQAFEPSFEVVEDALNNEHILTFLYLKPGDAAPRLRTVAPLALLQWNGFWHMLGHDLQTGQERTFLLSRILGQPDRLKQQTFPRGSENYAERLQRELSELSSQSIATLSVVAGSDAQARLTSKYGHPRDSLEVHCGYSDLQLMADEIVQFGSDCVVVSPVELQLACQARFTEVLSMHGGA